MTVPPSADMDIATATDFIRNITYDSSPSSSYFISNELIAFEAEEIDCSIHQAKTRGDEAKRHLQFIAGFC